MESTSTSKGLFVFKPFQLKKINKNKKHEKAKDSFSDELWYQNYKYFWDFIQKKLEHIQDRVFSNVLSDLVKHVTKCEFSQEFIPSVGFLTGTNLPDHANIFKLFQKKLKQSVTPYVAILDSKKCSSKKNTVEHLISQYLISSDTKVNINEDDDDYHLTKKDCNFQILEAWYKNKQFSLDKNVNLKKLIVIIPNFENFNQKCLQDLVLLINGYIKKLPFVLIFGISTTVSALHRAFPYHVSSILNVDIFHSINTSELLNNIIEEIFLSKDMPFYLGNKPFNFLIDVFLFYDFSIHEFTQGFKYFLMEHFYSKNHYIVCSPNNVQNSISNFNTADLDNLRSLSSFRRYVEKQSLEERKKLLLDDEYFKNVLMVFLKEIDNYWFNFNLGIRCLHILIKDLPKESLGKHLRQIYSLAMSKPISEFPEYEDTMRLLIFQSKEDLIEKIENIFMIVSENETEEENSNILFEEFFLDLTESLTSFVEATQEEDKETQEQEEHSTHSCSNRLELKEYLLTKSKKPRGSEKYEKSRAELLRIITAFLTQAVRPPTNIPFHETRLFSDISMVKGRVTGSPRAAIHMALTNPQHYLQCECCNLTNSSDIMVTLPDISVAYKLHLECGRLINLYDWLQSFSAVVNAAEEENNPSKITPIIQARFTKSVAELQHLGFIKPSKRKTDHVMRLTWGNS